MYRQKKYITGQFLEVEIFRAPQGTKKFKRAKRVKESSPAQKNLNTKKAERYFVRKVHLNFTEKDMYLDLTFEKDHLPKTRGEVRTHIKNYIARINYRRKKMGMKNLKYMYVISNMDNNGNRVRLHCHMVLEGMDRELVESLWQFGYANTERLKFDEYGVTGKSLYMVRQAGEVMEAGEEIKPGEKYWGCSTGLKNPEPIVSDKAIDRKTAEQMFRNPEDRSLFEKLFPGWTFTDCQIEINDITGTGFFIRLRKHETKTKRETAREHWGEYWIGTQLCMDVPPTRKTERKSRWEN